MRKPSRPDRLATLRRWANPRTYRPTSACPRHENNAARGGSVRESCVPWSRPRCPALRRGRTVSLGGQPRPLRIHRARRRHDPHDRQNRYPPHPSRRADRRRHCEAAARRAGASTRSGCPRANQGTPRATPPAIEPALHHRAVARCPASVPHHPWRVVSLSCSRRESLHRDPTRERPDVDTERRVRADDVDRAAG